MPQHPDSPRRDARSEFLTLLEQSITGYAFSKLSLGKYRGPETDLLKVLIRRISLRNEDTLTFVYRYKTKDITKNHRVQEGLSIIPHLIGSEFQAAHLVTLTQETQLTFSKNGKSVIRGSNARTEAAPSETHDNVKERFLDPNSHYWTDIGITDAQHRLLPSMSRKWKQIDRFLEIVDRALGDAKKDDTAAAHAPVHVTDYGAGKGYLTFAIHDYLQRHRGVQPQVTGVELREDLVLLCNKAAQRHKIEGLQFVQGDIQSHSSEALDIMIALHACDTATDHAIHKGIRAGASLIVCAPCCHKEIRPQIKIPQPLQATLRYGIHLGEEAEMITDSLRALLLEANGYKTQVFEFISTEHTSKNKMLLGMKANVPPHHRESALGQIKELKAFYGIQEQCLEKLLNG